jgi:hypothetical protein
MRTLFGHLLTLGEAVLVALALPVVILIVGVPIARIVRLMLEAARAI